jgi:hypothetical protein
MAGLFKDQATCNAPIGTGTNTANVKDMSSMFVGASDFNQPIGNWNATKVESSMFRDARAFNQPIGKLGHDQGGEHDLHVPARLLARPADRQNGTRPP